MEEVKRVIKQLLGNKIVSSIIVILISIVLYSIIHRLLTKNKKLEKNPKMSRKNKTYLKVLNSLIRYAFLIVTLLIVLQINGVDVSSLLAGAGILGIVLGFAVQDFLKDIIRGMTILAESYFSVGDVVQYKDTIGKVVSIGLSTTKIEDLITFNTISIANRNIEQIEVVSEILNIMVPLSYELPLKKSEDIMNQIVERVKEEEDVIECEYSGVNKFQPSYLDFYLKVRCNPVIRRPVMRKVHGIILETMEKNDVAVPYNQLDIHQK